MDSILYGNRGAISPETEFGGNHGAMSPELQFGANLLKIPIECIDIIISYLYPKTIGALKNTCRYLSNLMSIIRINNFMLGNGKSKSSFFKAIVKQNNDIYTQKLLEYAKREPFDNESFKAEYLGPL